MTNDPYSEDGVVDQVIGSAYQVVAYVAANMEILADLAGSVSDMQDLYNQVKIVIDNMADVNKLSDNMAQLLVISTNIEELIEAYTGISPSIIQYIARTYADAGLDMVAGSFEAGGTVASDTQVLLHKASGNAYSHPGPYPVVVAAGSSPVSPWVDRSDTILRNQLGSPGGADLVYGVAKKSVLASDDGAASIGTKGNIPGEISRTQQQSNNDRKSIRNFGGNDDAVGNSGADATNNFIPIQKYMAHVIANGGTAYFPRRGTGGYYINGSEAYSLVSQVELEVDEGVYFILDGNWSPLITKGIKANREIRVHIVGLNYDFYIGKHQYRRPSEVMPAPTQLEGVMEIPKTILGTQFTGYLLSSTSGRDITSITTDPAYISIPFSAASEYKVAAIKCKIGDEIGFTNSSGVGKVCLGVITPLGYSMVEQNLATGITQLNTNTNLKNISMGDFIGTRNQFNAATLAVRVLSDRKFTVLVNDISIGTFDAGGPITGIAFGATGLTVPFVIGDIYKVTNGRINGARPLRIICLGDSTSDPGIPCSQFDFMRQFLAAAGCQVIELNNLAVSGETSGQQWSRFDNTGVAGYDICIAQLGINDIQGGIPVNTFIANMELIADRCISNGLTFIASIPTTWYPKAEAGTYGGGGQDTANSHAGAIYRARLRKSMAAKGCLISSSAIRHEGAVSGAMLANAGIDKVLMDNIHPTNYGRMMMGLGNAMAVLGVVNPQGLRTRESITAPARWKTAATSASTSMPSVIIDNGELTLIGSINVASVPANGTAILTIDKELANGTYSYFTVPAQSGSGPVGMCNIVIDPNGSVTVYAVPAGTTNIVLDSITVKQLS